MTISPMVYRAQERTLALTQEWSVRVTACATVALAPVEGYLLAVNPQLGKIPAILLVIAWGFARFTQRRWPTPHIVHILLAALAVVVLASAAYHASDEFTIEYLVRWLPFLLVTGILVDVISSEVDVRALLASAIVGASAAAIGALYSVVVLGAARATGPLSDPNDLAFVLVGALPLTLAMASRFSRAGRLGMAVVAALLVIGIASTFSRGGGFALIAALVWLISRKALNPKVLATASAVVAAAGLLIASVAWPILTRAFGEKEYIAQSNIDSRLLRWHAASRMFAHNPLLGVGPGGFRREYSVVSRLGEIAEPTPVAHNTYLEVAAELGVIGLVLFLGIIATAFVASEQSLRMGVDRPTVIAIQASLLAMLVAAMFLSEQYYLSLWAVVAMACGLELRARGRARCECCT